ncbi:MAG TPA: hypothetical protein VMU19_02905 [Bryobacteraceae bacterium]|nr:hypothetical protein [Bryobacteraceae bacterium]
MRTRGALAAIWLCFLLRTFFYSAMLPLWEGYDEWSHFAVARIMATKGELLAPRRSPIPRDVDASLALAPQPYAMRDDGPPALTQDEFWKLPAAERTRRVANFAAIPPDWRSQDSSGRHLAYEAQHPPLYYWLAALALKVFPYASLATQVMLLRWMACLLASLNVPLLFFVARAVFQNDGLSLGCAAILAVMPEFAIDVARVSNECAAVPLFTGLILASVILVRDGLTWKWGAMGGLALGLGLLTKAYFLAAAPVFAVACLCAWRCAAKRASGGWRAVRGGALFGCLAPPVVIAGWWYLRNLQTSGTLSGIDPAVATRHMSFWESLHAALGINWARVTDGMLLSHIYYGGWSGLTVRAWMYHVFYAGIALAVAGLLLRRREPAMLLLAGFYALFWAAQCYDASLLLMSSGVAASPGWYAYAVAAAEIPLMIAGLRAVLPERCRPWVAPAGLAMFAALDLYTVHALAVPYYTGMVAHKANTAIAGLHGADIPRFAEAFDRLSLFKGPLAAPPVIAGLWFAYLAATGGLLLLIFRSEPGA